MQNQFPAWIADERVGDHVPYASEAGSVVESEAPGTIGEVYEGQAGFALRCVPATNRHFPGRSTINLSDLETPGIGRES